MSAMKTFALCALIGVGATRAAAVGQARSLAPRRSPSMAIRPPSAPNGGGPLVTLSDGAAERRAAPAKLLGSAARVIAPILIAAPVLLHSAPALASAGASLVEPVTRSLLDSPFFQALSLIFVRRAAPRHARRAAPCHARRATRAVLRAPRLVVSAHAGSRVTKADVVDVRIRSPPAPQVSELGDKTFFIATILAAKTSRLLTFVGAAGALAVMTVISVAIGQVFHAVPTGFTRGIPIDDIIAIASFSYFGLKSLADAAAIEDGDDSGMAAEQREAEEELAAIGDKRGRWALVGEAFALTFAAELGDRSQLTTIALSAAQNPFGVCGGAIIAHCLATGGAVLGGSFLSKYLSEKIIGCAHSASARSRRARRRAAPARADARSTLAWRDRRLQVHWRQPLPRLRGDHIRRAGAAAHHPRRLLMCSGFCAFTVAAEC